MYSMRQSMMDGSEGAAAWRDLTSTIHCAMDLGYRDTDVFQGRLERQVTDVFQLVRWRSAEVRFNRTARHIARDERGTIELFVPVNGTARVEQGSSRTVLGPGDMVLMDIDRPVMVWHGGDFTGMTLIVPAARAEQRGLGRLRDTILDGSRGLGRIARDMLDGLREERTALDSVRFDAVAERLVDLVSLAGTTVEGPGAESTHRQDIEASIRRYARDHVADPNLSARMIATGLGWSLRYVQAILRDAGTTPSELIRAERMALARTRLENPALQRHSIADIGRSCGFHSPSAFTAAFRHTFGMTPRQARQPR